MLIFSRFTTPAIFGLGVFGILVSALALIPADRVPAWAPHSQFIPGLDLQGGSCLLPEVDTNAIVKERLDAARAQALPALGPAGVRHRGLIARDRSLSIRPLNETNVSAAQAAPLSAYGSSGPSGPSSTHPVELSFAGLSSPTQAEGGCPCACPIS